MTFHYTAHADPAIDAFVEQHLQAVIDEVSVLMGRDLHAIILSGGFGRGEGSVLVHGQDDYHIVNDYDIEVVYREPFGRLLSKLWQHLRYSRGILDIANRLADRFDIKQIDLCLRGLESFTAVSIPTLAGFDLQSGHRLLFGDRDPVDLMPALSASDIPVFEGAWLLRNRAIGLLLANFYLRDGELDPDKREYFYIEINKAILAMGDALFILKKCYTSSYAERARQLSILDADGVPNWVEVKALYRAAARHKLFPGDDMYPDIHPAALWLQVNRLLTEFLLYYESCRLDVSFTSIADYLARFSYAPRYTIKTRLRSLFDRFQGTLAGVSLPLAHLKQDKPRSIALACTLLGARTSGGVDETLLAQACRLAGIERTGQRPEQEWRHVTRAFLLLVHPKGELGRTLVSLST